MPIVLFCLRFFRWHGFCSPSIPPRLGRRCGASGVRARETARRRAEKGRGPMENALLIGLSRQMALSHQLDIVANNVANIDTTGFKADNAAFSAYLMPGASDAQFSGKDRRVSFVEDRARWIDFSPGAIQHTGNPLDVAIDGKGYFVVQTPRGERY